MSGFCSNCGAPIPDSSKFCRLCGTAVEPLPPGRQTPPNQPRQTGQPQYAPPPQTRITYAGTGEVREGIPAPGFSNRVNHPEIIAAMKRNSKAALIFSLFIIPLPFAGFMIYSSVSGKMETKNAAIYGGIVSGVFLLFALIGLIKQRSSGTYDAVVTGKKVETEYRRDSSDSSRRGMQQRVYVTMIRTEDGRKKKIREREGPQIWLYNYVQAGDRFRYHPQFAFPYELYDKSKAPYIRCVACSKDNPVEADRCRKCGVPLLK